MNATAENSFSSTGLSGNNAKLNSLVEVIHCPLMVTTGTSDDTCDVPFLRSLFPQAQRCNCAKGGKCIVREVGKIDDKHSIVTVLFYSQVQKKPMPVDKIRAVIDTYCATHNA